MQHTWLCVLVLVTACSTTVRSSGSTNPATPDPRAELAAKRAVLLDRLHDYWTAGELPVDELGQPASVFRDQAGHECPMARMITLSGHGDLVAAVVQKNNRLKLADVHEGPLLDWMLASGLTRDEIVMVQGALDIDYGTFQLELPPGSPMMIAVARGEVKNRIRTAEALLRKQTKRSLKVAAAALPAGPRVPSKGPVIPKALEVAAQN
ncbi:MAG: hypothetical protein JWP01_1896 [Myxococcales bacterium]|nr:hypothetical protein [Myxococcales bacterium]